MSDEQMAALFLEFATRDHLAARLRLAARDPAGAALALLDASKALSQADAALEAGREARA